ncbi:MAG: S-layer homology domain-containing protein [Eubacteriales bacterium]|nr:S-layer homology domain-containing protein [Eubacteriales bacterium]
MKKLSSGQRKMVFQMEPTPRILLPVSSWSPFFTAMQWACEAGIIKGSNETTLNPKGSATRAEVAVILQRFLED